jgi:hypothetical protein
MTKKPEEIRIPIISMVEVPIGGAGRIRPATGDKGKGAARVLHPPALVRPAEIVTDIGVNQLREGVAQASTALREVFAESFAATFGAYRLDEVEVSLQISAGGKVGFLGTGVDVKGSSTLKLKFKREVNE